MRALLFSLSVVVFSSWNDGLGQTIQLFVNDFSSPLSTPSGNCGPDLCITPVNSLWQGTGTGTGGGGSWKQVYTVETLLINGSSGIYTDSTGQGGDYCLGMLSTFQNDKVALTLFSDTLPYVNLYMDVSAIDLVGCSGPFGTDVPSFRVSVHDSPNGVFNINNPGPPLDVDTLYGGVPSADPHHFRWTTVQTGLDVSGATDGNISVMWDLLTSGYAAFDNLRIEASISGVGLPRQDRDSKLMVIAPNPAHEWATLRRFAQGAATVRVLSASGALARPAMRFGPYEAIGFSTSDLHDGIYVVECSVGSRTGRGMLVVQH
ncbi:MAG: hypothetical protein IPM46_16060 [Flavobacteriales bacterium]|nr:hypothetical protein [Flavobacteriales bacterium]